MSQRLREAFEHPNFRNMLDGFVETDETFIGGKNKNRHKDKKVPKSQGRSWKDKTPSMIKKNVKKGSNLYSDDWYRHSKNLPKMFNHQIVNHKAKQYVNGNASTNLIENFWSHLKRGIYGIYHWISKKHTQRYVNEFTFRYNTRKYKEKDRFDLMLISAAEGILDLAGYKVRCYNLEDGTAILSTRGMQNALKMTDENDKQSSGGRLVENLGQKSLKSFVDRFKEVGDFDPIICYTENGTEIHGYKATVLPDICNIYLEARRNIHLSSRQAIIADQCEMIMSSFAKIGIIALVAEATGYQYERERDALQKQLDKILARPGFIGTLTNKYIYGNLPKGVLEKLKKETPKGKGGNYKHNLHQLLTTEVGREDAKKTIYSIETLFSISENMEEFRRLEEKYSRQKELLYIDLNLTVKDEKKQMKEDFDKKFKALLNRFAGPIRFSFSMDEIITYKDGSCATIFVADCFPYNTWETGHQLRIHLAEYQSYKPEITLFRSRMCYRCDSISLACTHSQKSRYKELIKERTSIPGTVYEINRFST
nr:2928_t:CDS:2 [Entrophospora candida]CAG8439361.1 2930_t:CDS:2 [Entrophospora candida]